MAEELADHSRLGLAGLQQRTQAFGHDPAGRDQPQPVLVRELEVREPRLDLLPEPPDAEVALAHARVVQEDDAARAHLREPRLEVMPDGLIRVIAVNVQQVNRAVAEARQGFVESASDEAGEVLVEWVVVRPQVFQHLRPVEAAVLVAPPHVYGEAARPQARLPDRLAEGAVGDARESAQLDDHARAQGGDQVHREGDVRGPGGDGESERVAKTQGVAQGVEGEWSGAFHDSFLAGPLPRNDGRVGNLHFERGKYQDRRGRNLDGRHPLTRVAGCE